MPYTIGQYNKSKDKDDDKFMDAVTFNLIPERQTPEFSPLQNVSGMTFQDECLYTGSSYFFSNEKSYFLHCKIKKRNMPQTFSVKLINKGAVGDDFVSQFVKEIIVPGGYMSYEDARSDHNSEIQTYDPKYDTDGWYDVYFTFTPFINFDTLWFQLSREKMDYSDRTRYPKIIYVELSTMRNILKNDAPISNLFDKMDTGIIKMGIQSRPHLLMFINKEEIRTDRSGIYEIRNSNVLVNSFTVIANGKYPEQTNPNTGEKYDLILKTMQDIDKNLPDYDDETEHKEDQADPRWESISSVSLINTATIERQIDSFTMDYMFRDKVNG